MESIKQNKILISIFIITFAFFIYFFFFKGKNVDTSAIIGVTEKSTPIAGDILSLLAQLHAVRIDNSLFESEAWTSLRDISMPLQSNNPGKNDLFGPLGSM